MRKELIIFFGVMVIGAAAATFFLFKKNKSAEVKTYSINDIQKKDESVKVQDAEESNNGSNQSSIAVVNNSSASENVTTNDSKSDNVAQQNNPVADKKNTDSTSNIASQTKNELISWGFQKASGRKIDTIVIHTTYNALGGDLYDYSKVLEEWKSYGVAPHYAIDRSGTIHQLVADANIAYHAGTSTMPDGRTNVNSFSIGIEVVNDQKGTFSDAEYSALNGLIKTLKGKYAIRYVVGHSDIAKGRKTDPWNIDWSRVNK